MARARAMLHLTRLAFAMCALGTFNSHGTAAEKFQRLSGAQIQSRLAGMEISDEVHWADVYERGGTLRSYSMGRKTIGKWIVRKNELCLDRAKEEANCYQVWNAGKKIELRRDGSDLPLQGVLQKPLKRD